jgi:hypothetical protein
MKWSSWALLALTFGIVGCSTASKDIAPMYVSPLQYQNYDCDQIAAEAARIQVRVSQTGGRLDEAAQNDQGLTAVGIVLFWPSLFFLGGTKQQEAEYARLRGEYDALQSVAIAKKCQSVVPSPAPAKPAAIPTSVTEPAAPKQ